jgi:hypothetical protein
VTRRLARGALVIATALAATVAAGTAPSGAQDQGPGTRGPIDHHGSRTGDGYTAAAALLTVDGYRGNNRTATDLGCVVPARPTEPAHVGRIISGPGPDGTYYVNVFCEIDADHPNEDATAYITYFIGFVTPLDPQALVEDALANLNLAPPVIETDPGNGLNSLTGMATYLWLDPAHLDPPDVTDSSDGLKVVISAEPTGDGQIIWDTGESTVTCANYGLPERSCSYTYQRSSLGQPGNQYGITASVTYTGSYTVYLADQVFAGPIDIGDVVVPTAPYLLGVAEAQSINTNPRRPPA